MAVIHHTTLVPTKLELLTEWLPKQPWYVGTGTAPQLAKAGGFRLDDPAGEVGIEFMFVMDKADGGSATYQVPVAYRGAPLDGGEAGLIGTMEHGVLGSRWVYDAAHDPVVVAQLLAFVQGEVVAQHQSETDTLADSVVVQPYGGHGWMVAGSSVVDADGRTVVSVEAGTSEPVVIELVRVLGSERVGVGRGAVEAQWQVPDGTTARGPVIVVR